MQKCKSASGAPPLPNRTVECSLAHPHRLGLPGLNKRFQMLEDGVAMQAQTLADTFNGAWTPQEQGEHFVAAGGEFLSLMNAAEIGDDHRGRIEPQCEFREPTVRNRSGRQFRRRSGDRVQLHATRPDTIHTDRKSVV